MTGSDKKPDDAGLQLLFDAARAARPSPSDDLMARITADAADAQPDRETVRPETPGVFRQILDALGGWPALGGLVTAAATGVYIGVVQPDILGGDVLVFEDAEIGTVDLWPGDAMFFEEG